MQTIAAVYFSPTGNTEKIIHAMFPCDKKFTVLDFNVTSKSIRQNLTSRLQKLEAVPDFWIFGSPVYSGQLPGLFHKTIAALDGAAKPAAGIVTYGNKSYGIAPTQLRDTLVKTNFNVVALGAFVGEHSYCDKFNLGRNRPDSRDIKQAQKLGKAVFNRKSYGVSRIGLKGRIDWVARALPGGGPKPWGDPQLCTGCGICVKTCPVDAIDPVTKQYKSSRAKHDCISCVACVKRCPADARSYHIPFPIHMLLDRFYFKSARSSDKEPVVVWSRDRTVHHRK